MDIGIIGPLIGVASSLITGVGAFVYRSLDRQIKDVDARSAQMHEVVKEQLRSCGETNQRERDTLKTDLTQMVKDEESRRTVAMRDMEDRTVRAIDSLKVEMTSLVGQIREDIRAILKN
jgi:ABC-type phosphate transport system auxiliary subunit